MPSYAPVSWQRHGQKKWRSGENYAFAAVEVVAPIVAEELGRAALFMPLAFVAQAGSYRLVAVLSFAPGHNLFVAPDGRWLSPHVPMAFRAYPFRLLRGQGTEGLVLCVDEESGLVLDSGATGEDFFLAKGELSSPLKAVLEFLTAVERSRTSTNLVVAQLGAAEVIKPWEIKLRSSGGEQVISGLHRIDESALEAISDDAFLTLRQVSALSLAYTQLVSTGQLHVLEQLLTFQQRVAPVPPAALPASLDSIFGIFGADDGVLRF